MTFTALRRPHLALLLTLTALFAIARPAGANTIVANHCDWSFNHVTQFDVADTICVDGDIDNFVFVQFFADAYIVPNQTWSGGEALHDIRSENRLVSSITGGGFFGEAIGLPGGTPRGEYDLILDDPPNGHYDPGFDAIIGAGSGFAFRVVESGRPVPDVSGIKTRAGDLETHYSHLATYWTQLLDLNDALAELSAVTGGPLGILEYYIWKPYNDLTGDFARKIIGGYGPNPNPPPERQAFGVAGNAAKHWGDLARDPADPLFQVLIPLDTATAASETAAFSGPYTYPFATIGTSQREADLVAWGNLAVEQAALVKALRRTFEKFQGADQAFDDTYAYLQARQLKKYALLLADNLTASVTAAQTARANLIATGDDDLFDVTALAAFQQRVINTGLTAEEQAQILALGFTAADVTEIELRIAGWQLPAADGRVSTQIDTVVADMTAAVTDFQTLAATSQALMDYLAPSITLNAPTADAGGPYTGAQGSSISLDGSASTDPNGDALSYAWDLDGDGLFDNAAGSSATFQSNVEGTFDVGLQVTDPGGNNDITYAQVTITSANDPPQITAFAPVSTTPVATAAAPLTFSVTATDPDGDPLSYEWTVDGTVVSTATTFTYTPAITDAGHVLVQVTVSDGSPFSVDARASRNVTVYSDGDGDTYYSDVDCNDADPAIHPGATEVCDNADNNCDGTIDEGFDADGDGFTTCAAPTPDCDDADPTTYPGAPEICDSKDNNCNGTIDEGLFVDLDGDGVTACGGDCDDTDPNNFPGNVEVCDNQDNNCDTVVDEGFDTDGDGFTTCALPTPDCNDADASIHPGAAEVCDLVDNNCDGAIDEGFDLDGDGVTSCGGDCDDTDPNNYPGNTEVCDNADNDCDGVIDNGFDTDGDGFTTCALPTPDCDDADPNTYPGAPELCDSKDNNCDGAIDEGVTGDADGDGVTICAGDCDDADPTTYPGAPELCDNADNDCNGTIDEGFDTDGDGFTTCSVPVADCDDTDAQVYPGRPEVPDNRIDDDCDAATLDQVRYASTFIIATDDNGRIYYAKSNGDGTWSDYRQQTQLSGSIRGAAIADFDNDGDLDFVVGSPAGHPITFHLFTNDGTDHFTDTVVGSGTNANSYQMDMAVGDFNHDGNPDFLSDTNWNYIHVGIGDGAGNFTITTVDLGVGNGRGMDAADFDEDGNLDYVRAVCCSGQITLYRGNGDGTFTSSGVIGDAGGDPYGVTAGDFNEDGHTDVLAIEGGSGNSTLFAGNGDGTFQAGVAVPSVDFNNHGAYDAYDFNRDGHQDLAATSYTSRIIRYYPGNGDGTFGAAVRVNPLNTPGNILGISGPPGPPAVGDPIGLILPNPVVDTVGATVNLDGSFSWDDSAITAYAWSFGDGATATGSTTTHTFPAVEGNYQVRLAVTDDSGNVGDGNGVVRLLGAPPVADAGGPYTFGEAFANAGIYTVPLDGSGSSDDVAIARYQWTFGDDWSDDFADGNANGWTETAGTWQVATEAYEQTDTAATRAVSVTGDMAATDYVYEADVVLTGGSGEEATLAFRSQGPDTRYEFILRGRSGTDDVLFYRWLHGSASQLVRVQLPFSPALNTPYHLKVEAEGNTFRLYVDGALKIAATDSNLTHGQVGLVTYRTAARFDNVTFTTGSGASAEGQTVNHTYSIGTYPVTLTVTDTVGQTATDATTVSIVAGAPPVADAGGPYVLGEADANCNQWTAHFDGTGSSDDNAIYTYAWDFGDGSTGSGTTPAHTYAAPGTYTVTLTVTDHALQTDTVTTTVTTTPGAPPVANPGGPYTVDESAASGGQWTVAFDGTGSTDDTGLCDYQWNFGDGSTATGTTPTHLYAAAGDYTVTLTVRDHAHQAHTATGIVHVTVNDPPVAAHGGPYAVDEHQAAGGSYTATFDAGGSTDDFGIWKYAWDFGDGATATGATPTHIYTAPGTYTVSLTVTDNGRQTTTSSTLIAVTTNGGPIADAGPPQTVEVGQPLTLDATGSTDDVGIFSYLWSFDLPNFTEDFAGGAINTAIWTASSGATTAGGEAVITGAGSWGNRYLVTSGSFERTAGDSYTGRIRVESGGNRYVMWGLKNTNTNYSYTQFPHAIYFDNNAIEIYENGSYRGQFGNFVDGTDYDVRIDLKANGATYFVRQTGAAAWTQLYDSANSTTSPLRFGATVHSGVIHLDDFAGPSPNATARSLPVVELAYEQAGTYHPSVTVTDNALQASTDAATITVVLGDPPVANTGGPYATHTQIPTRLNGRGSSDDFGIETYAWDFGDGESILSHNPWVDHAYAAAGTYTATLTVSDFAGQSASDAVTVNVTDEPVVACVPWAFSGGLEIPHDTWSGHETTLKGVAWSGQAPLTYTWDFGDGSSPVSGTVTNRFGIEAKHTYTGVDGAPFVATLTVTDASGRVASDQYLVRIRAKSLDIEINTAIDEGLWRMHKNQIREEFTAGTYGNTRIDHGHWDNTNGFGGASYVLAPTASTTQAFEVNAHRELGDVREDPYVETVARALRYIPHALRTMTISTQPAGDPDSNRNGIGIETRLSSDFRHPYEVGQVMDALVASGSRKTYAITGMSGIIDRPYVDLVQDMVDSYAWGQTDSGGSRGGWRYSWNSSADNSVCGWAAVGMIAAEDVWGLAPPPFVKTENDIWLTTSYDGTGFGYSGRGNGTNTTPAGMVQLAMIAARGIDDPATPGDDRDPRWASAEDFIANNWNKSFWFPNSSTTNRFSYYAYFNFTKAMRLARPQPVVTLKATGLDWFKDDTNGIARRLVNRQQVDGGWPKDRNPGNWVGNDLVNAWSVIILTPTLFVQPPVADAGEDRVWGVDVPLTLDGSRSFHLDPFRSIVKYEWDLDGDGVFDTTSTDPTTTVTYSSADYPEASLPTNVTVRLRVTDNNAPPKTDTDTAVITIAVPPHPPIADAGGPYTCTAGIPCTLDGSASFDIDPTDFITAWEWDTNNDGTFGDATGKLPVITFTTPGIQNVGLQVWDNAVLNDTNHNGVQDPAERLNDHDFTTVTVVANQPPVANAGGPYTVNEGSSVTLDGSASSDPNSDPLTYKWDLDNDGAYDDATGATAAFAGVDDTTATVGLWVSDGVLIDTTTTTVVVNNVAPAVTAGPAPAIDEGSTAQVTATFTDPGALDTHTATVDWGDGSAPEAVAVTEAGGNGSIAASHPYPQDGSYTVTITVTDDDGGVGQVTLTATVRNVAPVVDAGADQGVVVGQTVDLPPATFTDAGVNDTHTATVDWGDGASEAAPVTEAGGSGTAAGSHAYTAPGLYTVTVTVTDNGGGVGSDTFRVSVGSGNAPPTVDAGADQIIDEGPFALGATFTDSDLLDTHTATVDWGDGTPPEAATVNETNGSGSVTGSHTYPTVDTFTITVTVTDNGGLSGSDSLILAVGDGATPATENGAPNGGDGNGDGVPDRDQPLVTSLPSPGGSYVTVVTDNPACKANRFVASGSEADQAKPDPTYDYPLGVLGFTLECTEATITIYYEGQATLDGFTYRKYGPTTPGAPATTAWYTLPGVTTGQKVIGGKLTAFATFVLRDGELGDSTGVDGRIVDPGGPGLGPPTADAGGPYSVDEGSSVTLDGSGSSDPNNDPLTYAWDLNNDGVYDDAIGATPTFAGVDDAVYPIALEVSDGTFTATNTSKVTVRNVDPTVAVDLDRTINPGDTVALSPTTFADPGVNDTHTAAIDWGDGSPAEVGAVTEAGGNGSVSGSHTYTTAGTYNVTVIVTDNDGGMGRARFAVTVNQAAGLTCDIDGNGQVDINDIRAITAARNTVAAPGDPRDHDGNGVIDVNDARQCVLECTNLLCAP